VSVNISSRATRSRSFPVLEIILQDFSHLNMAQCTQSALTNKQYVAEALKLIFHVLYNYLLRIIHSL